jgi:hypothetical protein
MVSVTPDVPLWVGTERALWNGMFWNDETQLWSTQYEFFELLLTKGFCGQIFWKCGPKILISITELPRNLTNKM